MTDNRGDYADLWSHIKMRHPILVTENFAVFLDDELDVDWETTPDYDTRGHNDNSKHNSIVNEAALLETTPCESFDPVVKLHFKRLIGEGIARQESARFGQRFLLKVWLITQ